jgi:hypothetical protein
VPKSKGLRIFNLLVFDPPKWGVFLKIVSFINGLDLWSLIAIIMSTSIARNIGPDQPYEYAHSGPNPIETKSCFLKVTTHAKSVNKG